MTPFKADPQLSITSVTVSVANLERSILYYRSVIGLDLITHTEGEAVMGVGAAELMALIEMPSAQPAPRSSAGLYHFALLVPDRLALSRFLAHLVKDGVQPVGASDHLVSEAIYLTDPDGHGIEVYRDRPLDQWSWVGSQVKMANDPLDFDGLLADDDNKWDGIADATRIGHVHLRVNELAASREFYAGRLGFDVTAAMPGAIFVSAGRYHHHFGLNVWGHRSGISALADSARLISVQIGVKSSEYLDQIIQVEGTAISGKCAAQIDPSGNRLEFCLN